jgi:hypothetical protein
MRMRALLEVGDDLGDAEQAHRNRHEVDAIRHLEVAIKI